MELPSDAGKLTQCMTGRDLSMLARRITAKGTSTADFPALLRQFRNASNPNVGADATWHSLIVSEEAKQRLQTTCEMLRDLEGWTAKGVGIPKGILLEGPAGTGKTQIGRTIANEGGLGFVKATVADLKGLYLGHSAANVRDIFARARALVPSILFIDELDLVAPARGGSTDALVREIVSQLLQEMGGIIAQSQHVFVLAATNRPDAIDLTILSRFAERISIPLPDLDQRVRILEVLLQQAKSLQTVDADLWFLAEKAKGMSLRDMKNWVTLAQRQAGARCRHRRQRSIFPH